MCLWEEVVASVLCYNSRLPPQPLPWPPVIEEANWLTLDKDVLSGDGFDAVICLGNSFAHLPDCKGDQSEHRLALKNIASMVRPGGLLVIDHRNYDYILSTGCAPPGKNIYYKSDLTKDITTSVLTVNNKAHMVTLDYTVQVPGTGRDGSPGFSKFRLSYYPHCLASFTELVRAAFGGRCQHSVLGDFKPYKPARHRRLACCTSVLGSAAWSLAHQQLWSGGEQALPRC